MILSDLKLAHLPPDSEEPVPYHIWVQHCIARTIDGCTFGGCVPNKPADIDCSLFWGAIETLQWVVIPDCYDTLEQLVLLGQEIFTDKEDPLCEAVLDNIRRQRPE